MVKNGHKLSKTVKTGQNRTIWTKTVTTVKKCQKLSKTVKNSQNWLKKIVKNGQYCEKIQYCQKRSKIRIFFLYSPKEAIRPKAVNTVKTGQNWSKPVKIVSKRFQIVNTVKNCQKLSKTPRSSKKYFFRFLLLVF